MRRAGGKADPAAFGNGAIPFGIAGRGPQHTVLKPRRRQIPGPVEGGNHIVAQLCGFDQDGGGGVWRGIGETFGPRDTREIHHMIKDETMVFLRGAIGHGQAPAGECGL
ncbi:hypothetical protein MASR1M32_06820 [Rhodobacter sp.]